MKLLHILVGFVLFAILIGGSAGLVYAARTREFWEQTIEVIRVSRLQALEGAFVVLLLLALRLLTGIRHRKDEPFIAFETEGGSVSISMKAIRDFLARVGDEFAAVVSLDPVLRAVSGSMEVDLNLKVKSGTQIPELSKMLQERIRESIKDNLGLAEVRAIRIRVREIISPPPGKKQEKKADETAGGWEGALRS